MNMHIDSALLRSQRHAGVAEHSESDPRERMLFALGGMLQAGAHGSSVKAILDEREVDQRTRSLVELLERGVQSPAMVGDPAWAGALVTEAIIAFTDMLAQEGSVVAQLPALRFEFGKKGKVTVPVRAAPTPTLAAAFREEGDPIRVGAMSLAGKSLTPKSMAVIATVSNELIRGAGPGVMDQLIRASIVSDTSRALDQLFLDNTVGSDLRPAGLQTFAVAPNTAVSTGVTAAAITADTRARLAQLHTAGFGGSATRWIMHSSSATTLATLFDEMRLNGTHLRVPVISSLSVPVGVVFLVDCKGVILGADAPRFDWAQDALLHEENTTPLAAGAPPSRSLWQTNVLGLRAIWPLDWLATTGAVQTITGVSW
jgi:hypothetical protein